MRARPSRCARPAAWFILGTERHESRRIDQPAPGAAPAARATRAETCFFLSLEDDILRLFGGERIQGLMDRMGVDEDTPIDAKMLSGAIENAQKRVESRNFQARKDVLDYDDVMNTQREVIYDQRRKVLSGENLKEYVASMIRTIISSAVHGAMGGAEAYVRRELAGRHPPSSGGCSCCPMSWIIQMKSSPASPPTS